MSIANRARNFVLRWLTTGMDESSEVSERYRLLRRYERGDHRRQLKVRPGQPDDNISINFAGLIVDRTVSMLFGNGIEFSFDYPTMTTVNEAGEQTEQESPQEELLDDTWDANKQQILLHKLAYYGGVYGTCYVKLVPEGIESREEPGRMLTRLVALNPNWLTIETDPEDQERVTEYAIEFRYTTTGPNGQQVEIARREETTRETREEKVQAEAQDNNGEPTTITRTVETGNWTITNYVSSQETGGKWQQVGQPVQWAYTFPPILHWQNLPDPENVYGISDIEDVLDVQDRYNFTQSNISKIIRFFAHPMRWGRGLSGSTTIDLGPDKMVNLTSTDGMIQNLEMQSDLASSRAFALDLRQSLFDVSRTVDLSSIADKLGSLTNFGLRVLYLDSLNKNATKRELYEDALVELNHRLLVLAGYSGASADGGHIVWPDPLPVDRDRVIAGEVAAVAGGIESRQTAAENIGNDWDDELERIQEATAGQSNIGEMLLKSFSQGQ